MGMSIPFNLVNFAQLVRDWLDDYYFDESGEMDDDEDTDMFGEQVPGKIWFQNHLEKQSQEFGQHPMICSHKDSPEQSF